MERKEIDRLINRLNNLSDNPTKNLNKMREIARVLVDFYMPNKNTHGNDGMCKLLKDDGEKEQ